MPPKGKIKRFFKKEILLEKNVYHVKITVTNEMVYL